MATIIHQITDEELKEMAKDNSVVIVDIREPMEFAREKIPHSRNVPVAELTKADFSNEKDKKVIFTCRMGNRTRNAESALHSLGLNEIYCLTGGIEQWKRCGLKTEIDKSAPIDLMRQVQIAAGSLILLGFVLAYLVAPEFILLPAFVGIGLLVAGITGFCGMAKLLMLMPWNKINK